MTREKDFKRLVRARMLKTGEAYTAARAQILSKPTTRIELPAPSTPKDYAALAGISDRSIKKNTGCTWERWVPMLDGLGAAEMRHREIAALVSRKFKINDWWSQTVTWGNGTVVIASFTAKSPVKSAVAVSHTKLDDRAEADRLRQYWSERLDALGETLSVRATSQRFAASEGR